MTSSDQNTKDAQQAAKTAAEAAVETAKRADRPIAPMPSEDEGKDKKVDKGDWSML